MRPGTAGIILAGGRSRRMGADKALFEIDGETMLARSVRIVSTVVSEVLIVGRTVLPEELAGTPTMADAYGDAGPLGGVVSGLEYLDTERVLAVSCDLPYLQANLLRLLVELAPGYDAVVPRVPCRGVNEDAAQGRAQGPAPTASAARENPRPMAGKGKRPSPDRRPERPQMRVQVHPACALYGRTCLPSMLSRLGEGRYRLQEALNDLHVRWVSDEELRQVDPEGRSLLNANTPDDWRDLMRLDRAGSSHG